VPASKGWRNVSVVAMRDRLAQRLKQALFRLLPDDALNALVRRRMPRSGMLEATVACNLSCPLCPTHIAPRDHPHLALEHVENVLRACGSSLRTLCFHVQGEPLLNPELFDIIRRCSRAGVQTLFATNGMLLDRHLDDVLESGLDGISIAIDGASAEDYEKYRVGGDYERVLRNTRALIEERRRREASSPTIQVQALMFGYNARRERELYDSLLELGADEVCLKPPSYFYDLSVASEMGFDLDVSQPMRAAEEFREQAQPGAEGGRWDRGRSGARPYRLRRLCPQLERIAVLSDGRAVACCMDAFGVTAFGDLGEADFGDIWRGEEHLRVIRSFLERELAVCRHCTLG